MKPIFLDSEQRLLALKAIFDASERDGKLEGAAALDLIKKLKIFGEPEEPIEPLAILDGDKLMAALTTLANRTGASTDVLGAIWYKIGLAVGAWLASES